MRLCAANPAFRPAYKRINGILITLCAVFLVLCPFRVHGEVCARPQAGSVVTEPPDLRSKNGILEINMTAENVKESDGRTRYCFVDDQGRESPSLRVNPGDRIIIHLKNAMTEMPHAAAVAQHAHSHAAGGECASGAMTLVSTNLHFHGLTIPPTCHQDDVLKTSLEPGDTFDYSFRIPDDEAPGLYWYHPHIHGFGKPQLLGGASGALIVEGIERAKKEVAGLPERVLIIRDQDLVNPNSPPSKSEPVVPKFMIDKDGDSANNGTGFGKPAKDLSINYVPVPYPDYPPATIQIKPGEKQLWRLLNASAITYLNIQMLFGHTPQQLGLVAMDGVPIGLGTGNQDALDAVNWQTHLGIPPGSRVEFIVQAPAAGQDALLVTRTVDTGPGGENDTNRALAKIVASADAAEPISRLQSAPQPLLSPAEKWLGAVAPVRVRHLYFSEKLTDPNDPASAVEFYLTEEGKTPKMFEMNAPPDLVAQQGTVEDWIIENRSAELHAFHIHQLHFLLLEYMGRQVNENFLRDTVNVPYYGGRLLTYPSIRIRVDFRDPNTVGIFPYHCHLLEHEDKGMMGTILVEPAQGDQKMSAEGQHKALPESRTAQ
ncbi:multicopper oxidase domain-containing protein [Alloacidobacterium dinghuense]|uniref:Multicopper oxidase domain-containing protein n=1 Tax=Alloacidobacterium dinghuense TaxID=2763107 RepID=A0A7G8BE98_9BACT|nr:multicopper oxidase family protein [Alloacidobacterium dinghuense]QNI30868.1 multicopper oxidase domain-containing protein [Alloacidobacterium dinghuense]